MADTPLPNAVLQGQDMWVKIRHEWEKIGLSDRTLANRWGFRSANSILRRRSSEGWKRDIDSVTTRLVTQAVASVGASKSAHMEITSPHTSGTVNHQINQHMLNGTEQKAITELTRGNSVRGRQAAQHDLDDARDMRTARGLAEVHTQAIADQVEIAEAGAYVVSAVLGHLTVILTSLDMDEVKDSRDRLMAINPEKDSMAGHMKAAGVLMEQCVKIKRLALAMDVTRDAEPPPPPASRTQEIIKRLDVETLMKMRQTALEVSRLSPTIHGEAE